MSKPPPCPESSGELPGYPFGEPLGILYLVLGLPLAVLLAYSWLYAQGLHLVGLSGPYWVPEIEPLVLAAPSGW